MIITKYIRTFITICFITITHAVSAHIIAPTDSTSVTGKDIVKRAMKYIGVPYRSGRMNPKIGFDCSGFTSYVFQKENILLTRSSRSQFQEGIKVDDCKDLKKGDLVFFCGSRIGSSIGHVGIVTNVDHETGAFSFIHASRTGVRISSSTEPYYEKRYVGACRVLS